MTNDLGLVSARPERPSRAAWAVVALLKGGDSEFFLTRTMTTAEVGALGIPGAEGGLQSVSLQAAGKLYTFALRPLLPDEISRCRRSA